MILTLALLMSGSVSFSMEDERKPLPSPEVIAKLAADGGEEFNRLVFSKSPYLLQHARNPVDWYEWGPEAFALAAKRDVPVFLSIGYSTCHWCHVMEHESFEDDEVAALMNESFVCIKVDREERPDIDQLYMTVTQSLTGSGGWPMTVVMTPGKKPFFAGTYFPKEQLGERYGMMQLVPGLSNAWKEKREDVLASANGITDQLAKMSSSEAGEMLGEDDLARAEKELEGRFDEDNAGFGFNRKFPVPHEMQFLLRRYAKNGNAANLKMVEATLRAWRMGGIFDHVGLGIHRYSTDAAWLVPHFEKMLYDQALCSLAYVDAWRVTKDATFERAAREILTYVARDMTAPGGGFYSAEDADSEGEEGLFYLWTVAEVEEVLGKQDAAWVIENLRMTEEGNYRDEATGQRTGRNILHLSSLLTDSGREKWEPLRAKLFDSREARIHPLKDDKVLTDWNGLMITAFAEAGRAFGDVGLIGQAERAAGFLRANLLTEDARLMKRSRGGEAGLQGMLEDYAFTIQGLLSLFEASHKPADLELARRLTDSALEYFWDEENGGFFLSPDDGEKLVVRSKEAYDGARPSGNSVMATQMLRLARMTGEMSYEARAIETVKAFSPAVASRPSSHTQLLAAVDFVEAKSREIVIVGDPESPEVAKMLRILARRYAPNDVVLLKVPGPRGDALALVAPYTAVQSAPEGGVAAYVCEGFACKAPVATAEALEELLKL